MLQIVKYIPKEKMNFLGTDKKLIIEITECAHHNKLTIRKINSFIKRLENRLFQILYDYQNQRNVTYNEAKFDLLYNKFYKPLKLILESYSKKNKN